jgi:hypothetical protein
VETRTNPNSSVEFNLLGGVQLLLQLGQLLEHTLSVAQHLVHHLSVTGPQRVVRRFVYVQFAFELKKQTGISFFFCKKVKSRVLNQIPRNILESSKLFVRRFAMYYIIFFLYYIDLIFI